MMISKTIDEIIPKISSICPPPRYKHLVTWHKLSFASYVNEFSIMTPTFETWRSSIPCLDRHDFKAGFFTFCFEQFTIPLAIRETLSFKAINFFYFNHFLISFFACGKVIFCPKASMKYSSACVIEIFFTAQAILNKLRVSASTATCSMPVPFFDFFLYILFFHPF